MKCQTKTARDTDTFSLRLAAFIFSSLVQSSLIKAFSLKFVYMFGLLTFGLSMLLTVLYPNVIVLNICAAISGLGFSVTTTVPYTLITLYHTFSDVFYRDPGVDGDTSCDASSVGYGEDIAILDSSYYMSQIILSTFMGQIVEMTGMPHLYMVASSLCGFIAAYLARKVVYSKEEMYYIRKFDI